VTDPAREVKKALRGEDGWKPRPRYNLKDWLETWVWVLLLVAFCIALKELL
jgi:hypothetical protein